MILEVLKHCYNITEKLLFEHDPQAMDADLDNKFILDEVLFFLNLTCRNRLQYLQHWPWLVAVKKKWMD